MDNNPVVNWMVQHCQTKTDKQGREYPIKEDERVHWKIDAVDAFLMALKLLASSGALGAAARVTALDSEMQKLVQQEAA